MTQYLSLEEIKTEVRNLARIINAPEDQLPTYGHSRDFGYPHIEVDAREYHYVVVERGTEFERRTTEDIHQLLYWVFDAVTSLMAFHYELHHRDNSKDCRRIAFQKQIELLQLLNPEWAELQKKEHEAILREYPFDDLAGIRAKYCGELRAQDYSEDEIEKMAREKYP